MSEKERKKLIDAIIRVVSYPASYFESLTDKELLELYEYHTLR